MYNQVWSQNLKQQAKLPQTEVRQLRIYQVHEIHEKFLQQELRVLSDQS